MQEEKLAKGFINGSLAVDKTRAIKDEEEKQLMRRSSAINDEAMGIFKTLVKEGISEKEVADKIGDIYRSLGADDFSFDAIVAFGKNAADPHHMPDDTKLRYGDVVLFDVGCTYKGYCSDMTRTFFFKQGPNKEQEEIYDLVRKANEDAERYIKAGVRLCDIDKTARDVIENGGYGKFFTHRLGHFIGIEDHEYGDVSAAFKDLTETDNIFSIEPGIYDPDTLGCRIEDLVIVTDEGCEVLNHYPHEIEIIG
jgi:Xaa-Pro dipeptidase